MQNLEELKQVILSTFEHKGILQKFKAQIKASIYKTLDQNS